MGDDISKSSQEVGFVSDKETVIFMRNITPSVINTVELENLGKVKKISKMVKQSEALTFDIMKFILDLKSNIYGVKKGSDGTRAELSWARPVRAGGEDILASVILKFSENQGFSLNKSARLKTVWQLSLGLGRPKRRFWRSALSDA